MEGLKEMEDPNHVVLFSNRSKDPDALYLSNHTDFVFRIGDSFAIPILRGRLAASVASAYESAKFAFQGAHEEAKAVLNCSPAEAERRGSRASFRQMGLQPMDLDRWYPVSKMIMGQLIRYRAGADAHFRSLLTGNRRFKICHRYVAGRGSRWGGWYRYGSNEWVGENELGRLFDEIGDELNILPTGDLDRGRLSTTMFCGSSSLIVEGWLANALMGL